MLRILIMAALIAPAPALAGTQKERERRICKREKAETGSHVRAKRICLTEAEWKQALDNNRQTVKSLQEAIDGQARGN